MNKLQILAIVLSAICGAQLQASAATMINWYRHQIASLETQLENAVIEAGRIQKDLAEVREQLTRELESAGQDAARGLYGR